ncbi:MAG: IS21 family transposase [Thermodesulfobacteriota bacterium]|nr:IS21 family transposase [Thermodesulfobacteriota bacterium]
MLGEAMYITIHTLWKKGLNKSQISRATGHDWKTVTKVIKKLKSDQPWPEKKPHPCLLEPHKEKVLELIETGLSAVRIHEELSALGIGAAYPTVKRYVADIKKREKIFIRIHTKPGEESQVDFGYVGYTIDDTGKRRKTWVFNMKMSYSRLDFYKTVYNQRVETFIDCHEEAFKYFGGVPECVRIDNLKAAILKANFYEPVYQRMYKNFADYYGFQIIPCRTYHPNDKGKVESGIKYVKNNFFAGRQFANRKDLDKQLYNWQENKCNVRIHGTTRKIPREVFETKEKELLRRLRVDKFKMVEGGKRKVYHDCHIFVKHNYYSVPFEYIKKEVEIELSKTLLKVYYNNKEIAIHERLSGEGGFATEKSHYPKYKIYSDTEHQEVYQAKMADIGKYGEQIFFAIVDQKPRIWGQPIRGILSLTKKYPKEIVDAACKRALAFNVYKYQIVKNICANGSYVLPLEFNTEEVEYEYA